MKHSRDYLLLGALAGLLLATAILVWSHRQLNQLTAAQLSFEETRLARRAALDDAAARLARLKTQLRDVQRDDRVPPTYDEWSRQQTEARTAVAALYQRALELSRNPDATIVPQPGLQSATRKLQTLAAQLRDAWRDFEQAGSGLTPASRDFAAAKLLPLLADELPPALDEAAVAETANAEHLATTFPILTSPPRLIRRVAFAGCALSLLLLAHALTRRAPKKLLAAALSKSSAEAAAPVLAGKFAHNAAALDASAPKILVAENHAAESATLSLLLSNAGYAVVTCDNGAAARDALQRIPFALVLIDRHLPQHDGPDLLREARQRQPKLPAILLCDADEPGAPAESSLPFLTQIIRRPLHPRTLLWTVSEILYPGENRESRDYSPSLPDPDEKTPAPVAEEPSPSPVEQPPPPPPPPVAEVPRLRRREVPAAPIPPAIETPVEPPAPRLEPPPAPAPSAEPEPTQSAPALPEAASSATSVPTDAAPAPRKKLVRRKILPADET